MSEVIIGVDLGGTNVKAAVVSRDKELLAKDSRPTRAEDGPDVVMQVMQETVEDLLKTTGKALRWTGVGTRKPKLRGMPCRIASDKPRL